LASGNPFGDPTAALHGALVWGALRHGGGMAMNAVDQRVTRQVAQLLTSNDPAQLRMGMRVLGRNARLLDSLRQFDAAAARAGAVQLQPSQRAQ